MSQKLCGAEKADGGECQGWKVCDECGTCYVHCTCPEVAEERTRARQKGGHNSATKAGSPHPDEIPPAPKTLEDAVLWAAWAARAAAAGDLGTPQANAAARLLKEFRQALEKSEAKQELEDLRRKLEELRGDGRNLEAL